MPTIEEDKCYHLPEEALALPAGTTVPDNWLQELAEIAAQYLPKGSMNFVKGIEAKSEGNDALRNDLKILYHWFMDESRPDEFKQMLAYKLNERIQYCVTGLQTGIRNLLIDIQQPRSLDDLLYRVRKEMVDSVARQLTGDVHRQNYVQTRALEAYKVRPSNPDDHNWWGNHDTIIDANLHDSFERFKPFFILNHVSGELNQALSMAGYEPGKGFSQQAVERCGDLLANVFSSHPLAQARNEAVAELPKLAERIKSLHQGQQDEDSTREIARLESEQVAQQAKVDRFNTYMFNTSTGAYDTLIVEGINTNRIRWMLLASLMDGEYFTLTPQERALYDSHQDEQDEQDIDALGKAWLQLEVDAGLSSLKSPDEINQFLDFFPDQDDASIEALINAYFRGIEEIDMDKLNEIEKLLTNTKLATRVMRHLVMLFKQADAKQAIVTLAMKYEGEAVSEMLGQLAPEGVNTILSRATENGETPLLLAARHHPTAVPHILESMKRLQKAQRKEILSHTDNRGITALMTAAGYQATAVQPIIDAIPPEYLVEMLSTQDKDGLNPLMYAAILQPAAVQPILDAIPEDARGQILFQRKNSDGNALMSAALSHGEAVQPILDAIPESNRREILLQQDKWGNNVLINASSNAAAIVPVVRAISENNCTALWTQKNKYGETPLLKAAKRTTEPNHISEYLKIIPTLPLDQQAVVFSQYSTVQGILSKKTDLTVSHEWRMAFLLYKLQDREAYFKAETAKYKPGDTQLSKFNLVAQEMRHLHTDLIESYATYIHSDRKDADLQDLHENWSEKLNQEHIPEALDTHRDEKFHLFKAFMACLVGIGLLVKSVRKVMGNDTRLFHTKVKALRDEVLEDIDKENPKKPRP